MFILTSFTWLISHKMALFLKKVEILCIEKVILGDPGAVSRDDTMFVVKVYCKIETSPWALSLTESVPEVFGLPASDCDWPEKNFSGQSTKRSSWVTLVFPYTT